MRRLELGALLAVMLFVQAVLLVWVVLRGSWLTIWETWGAFWHAVALYVYQGYRWRAAWRTASRGFSDGGDSQR